MSAPAAEIVFKGGTVVTVDPAFATAQAAAVGGGRIVAVGADREINRLIGSGTRVIDLRGGALLPGINDSHVHAAMLGAYWPAYWMDAMAADGDFPVARELDSEDGRRAALRRAWDVLIPLGITSYTEPGLGPGADHQHGGSCGAAVLETYRQLAAEGALPLRVNALALYGELDGPSDPGAFARAVAQLNREDSTPERRLRLAGVKIFADGIPPARSAWMDEPYTDGGEGALLLPGMSHAERVSALELMVHDAHARGLQIGVHATGSATIDATVRAFVRASDRFGNRDLRHYVIHGDTSSPQALATMAQYRFGLNTQPAIYVATGPLLEAAIGRERTERAFALRSALSAGVAVSLSSDAPVLIPDWRLGIVAAVERRLGAGTARGIDERISVQEAIRAYTIVPAAQDHAEAWKGSIEVGKVADLCVLDANPLAVKVDDIPSIGVRMTLVDGVVIHEVGGSPEIGAPRLRPFDKGNQSHI